MKLSKKITVFFGTLFMITTLLFIISGLYLKNNSSILSDDNKMKEVLIIFICINLFITIIMITGTKKIIRNKIKSLDKQISSINCNSDMKARIEETEDNDEFARLARDINNMFQSIEDQNNLIVSNEKKYSNLVEGLDNGYAYFKILRDENGNVKDAFIVEVNASLVNMLGIEKESLLAGSFNKIIGPFIKDEELGKKILKEVGGKYQSVFRTSVRLGVDRWSYLTVYPIESEYFAMIFTDISENKRFAEEMKHLANYDVLTGIRNRFCIYNYLEQLKKKNEKFAIYYIDLDHFKTINDTLGHSVGDEVLVRTADVISKMDEDKFIVGRLGGDEFLGIREGSYTILELKEFGEEILKNLNAVKSYNDYPYKIEASLGASRFIDDTDDIETLLKYGDIALYKSKKAGRNKVMVFDSKMKEESIAQDEVKSAIEEGKIIVYYQPIYDISIEKSNEAEALIRWKKGDEIIDPMKFLLIAKESDDIIDIDTMVFNRACEFCKKRRDMGEKHYEVSINTSMKFLLQNDLITIIKRVLMENDLEPSAVRFDISEEEIVKDINALKPILEELHKLGIKIALDSFGMGYSSFNYIKELPLDSIKIDKSLLTKVERDKKTLVIIEALIKLAHNLNIEVVVEGVEQKEQYEYLKELSCDKIQGYYISKAVPEEEFI